MNQVATIEAPRLPTRDAPKHNLRVRGKLFDAIELIVFDGHSLEQAAQQSGMTTYSLRQAFAKPHVLAHLKARREVLRAAASGKNILRLCEIRDADNNMPAVNAIKALEQLGEESAMKSSQAAAPGVTIIIASRTDANEIKTLPPEQQSRHMIEADRDA